MSSSDKGQVFKLAALCGWLPVALLLSGCSGFAVKGEKEARQQSQTVARDYRPHGQKPALPVLTSNSSLSNFLTYAMLNQPKVEAAYYDWLGSVEQITVERSLPDPQLTFQMDIQKVVTSIMPGIMGNIPWPEKLRAGAQVASAESQAKYFTFQSTVLEAAFEVKRAYYQLFFLEDKLRVNRETLNVLSDLEKLARAQNEVGKVTLQDVLRAQIEQNRLRTEIANLEDSREPLVARFKAALGMPASEPDPPIPQRFESAAAGLGSDKALDLALTRNQQLKSLEAEVRAAEASILLAREARRPDFSLGFMADVKANPTLYRLPGGPGTMSLPIWRDKLAAQLAAARDNKSASQARLSASQIDLALRVAEKSFLYREATRSLHLLQQELLPKQQQSLEVARSGYVAGQIDFFNLTDAQQTLLRFRLEEVEARTQRELSLAELGLIIEGMPPTGGSLGSLGTGMPVPTQSARGKTAAGM